jgi:hypothetical protein
MEMWCGRWWHDIKGLAMTRRRRLVVLGLPFFLAIAAAIWFLTRPRPHIDLEHYNQIKHGMTLGEVGAIIGAAPGNYGGADPNAYGINACQGWICSLFQDWRYGTPTLKLEEIQAKLDEGRIVVWTGRQHAIAVQLDAQDRVVATGLGGRGWQPPTWWEQLLEWLGIE